MTARDNHIKKDWLLILMILASFGIAAYFYPILPDKVPSHWNLYGEVDAYSSRFFGAFSMPLLNIGMYVLFLVTPYIDPKRANYKFFEGAYRMFRILMHIFMFGLQAVILAVALGYELNVALIVKVSVSVLFILVGNVMGRFRFNYFVGIKTPWTLANEEVWKKTHRMAARVWVAGGLICAAASFWHNSISAAIFFLSIIILVFVPLVYSYIEYQKLRKDK